MRNVLLSPAVTDEPQQPVTSADVQIKKSSAIAAAKAARKLSER
jgi:hypothetical protein